jgi:hypothetical protein
MSRRRRDYIERDEYRRRKIRRFTEGFCCLGFLLLAAAVLAGSALLAMMAGGTN